MVEKKVLRTCKTNNLSCILLKVPNKVYLIQC